MSKSIKNLLVRGFFWAVFSCLGFLLAIPSVQSNSGMENNYVNQVYISILLFSIGEMFLIFTRRDVFIAVFRSLLFSVFLLVVNFRFGMVCI